MSDDLESDIDKALSHKERAVVALEAIADALTMYAKIEAQRFEKEYPVKVPRDATVTHLPSDEEKTREDLGASDEPLDEWTTLGPRERAIVKKKTE